MSTKFETVVVYVLLNQQDHVYGLYGSLKAAQSEAQSYRNEKLKWKRSPFYPMPNVIDSWYSHSKGAETPFYIDAYDVDVVV